VELRRRLGGVHGCTHLVELFGPLATTASDRQSTTETTSGREQCHAASADRHVSRTGRRW
jgi:hypothetical protein